ncbi:hypothetical protein F5Y06DRAFT_308871 [Hypoxylon sp. FL0890]|nr:hypothetical protein F5Y06DRAFT_308871 [Hypoxylon sp. FL0890]
MVFPYNNNNGFGGFGNAGNFYNRKNSYPSPPEGNGRAKDHKNDMNPRYRGRPEDYDPDYDRRRVERRRGKRKRDGHEHSSQDRDRDDTEHSDPRQDRHDRRKRQKRNERYDSDEYDRRRSRGYDRYHHHYHHIRVSDALKPLKIKLSIDGENARMTDIDDLTTLMNRHANLRAQIRTFLLDMSNQSLEARGFILHWVQRLYATHPFSELTKALEDNGNGAAN